MSTPSESVNANPPSGAIRVYPWRRFWARQIDYMLFELVLLTLLLLVAPSIFDLWPSADSPTLLVAQGILSALWVAPEALLLSTFRTTPGKWMLGILVQGPNGRPPTLSAALKRSVKVWVLGTACGIYPISLLAFLKSYRDLESAGTTSWDSQIDLLCSRPRRSVLVSATALLVSLNVLGAWAVLDTTTVVETEIQASVKEVTNYYSDHGLEVAPVSPTQLIRFGDGEVRESGEHLQRGGSVVIVGACDEECSDLDLTVFDPEGTEVGRDREANDRPWIWLEPELTGQYRILATMHKCAADGCTGGYRVLRSDSSLPTAGEGTGFVVDANGAILTADHVIDGASSITVLFSDGVASEARVERRSPANDLALLRVEVKTPVYLTLATPRSTRVGDRVFVVGFPLSDQLGEEIKFTDGSVTALSGANGESAQFQMSVPIQPGNSGSPVVDLNGHVVGIATSSASDQAMLEEAGAVPQLVNWATKAEIALALVERQQDAWTASNADEARLRARSATVRLLTQGNPQP